MRSSNPILISAIAIVVSASLAGGACATPDLKPVTLSNGIVSLTIYPAQRTFTILDNRNGRTWRAFPIDERLAITSARAVSKLRAEISGVLQPENSPVRVMFDLAPSHAEFTSTTIMPRGTQIAAVLNTAPAICERSVGSELVVPIGEGMLYPTDSPSLRRMSLDLSCGNDITMPWFGVVDPKTGAGVACIVNDRDDAEARLEYREAGESKAGSVTLGWRPQHGRWGYDRTVTFFVTDRGGYVALAKRYRRHVMAQGRFVTLAEKRKRLPELAKLCGAPDMWLVAWDSTQEKRDEGIKWFHDQGIDRMLCSALSSDPRRASSIALASGLGYITGRYDLYTDVWDPKVAGKPGIPNQSFGYPEDVLVQSDGSHLRGWAARTEAGEVKSYLLCATRQLKWARRRIPADLKDRPYSARFIDVTGGLGALECYSPDHPCTRSQDKQARRDLLGYVGNLGLVCGTETAGDWAAPVISYTMGIMSPVPYRAPDAGYLPETDAPPADTLAYELNPAVRVPLWELVYHDSVVAYWYWGDTTNTYPSVWDLRNAFNALYATPPLFMLPRERTYLDQRGRIVETCKLLKPVFEAVGFSEMTSHRFLSADRMLQESEFAGGVRVIVNFSDVTRSWLGRSVPARGYVIVR